MLFFSSDRLPRSYEIFVSPFKELIHPNRTIYDLILKIEYLFRKHRASRNSFDLIVSEFSSAEIKLHFPCKEHSKDVSKIYIYIVMTYLQIRMREYIKQEMANIKKESVLKKKATKLCTT